MTAQAPVLRAERLSKRYGAVTALDSVDLEIHAGQILALVGDNGAGKSTLVKILSGAIPQDSGRIFYRGQEVTFHGPHEARARGIESVYQNLALAGNLDVASSLYLGRELVKPGLLGRLGILDRRAMVAESTTRLRELGVSIPAVAGLPVDNMSGGQQQAVAVTRAAAWARDVLFMDEPTAALGVRQSRAVLELATRLAREGVAVVLISHILPHVIEIADRVTVLRHGRKVADIQGPDMAGLGAERLVSLIVGADGEEE